jgi:hypothetical protein
VGGGGGVPRGHGTGDDDGCGWEEESVATTQFPGGGVECIDLAPGSLELFFLKTFKKMYVKRLKTNKRNMYI